MKTTISQAHGFNIVYYLLAMITTLFMAVSCSEDASSPVYEDKALGVTPVITNVEPAEKAVAGVSEITITGTGFSTDATKNQITFNAEVAKILENSSTKIIVQAPNIVSDSIKIKVANQDGQLFSNFVAYKLTPAVEEAYAFKENEKPYALTLDENNNIYFSLTDIAKNPSGQGINKISSDSLKVTNVIPKSGETFYFGLKYNSTDGYTYGVYGNQGVFRGTEGGVRETYKTVPAGAKFNDLDFDANLTIWLGGGGGKIYSMTSTKEVKGFDFEPVISSVRVYNNYLYVAGAITDSVEAVWRFEIFSSDSLGDQEMYFDFSSHYSSNIRAITFSDDGDMFIGTNGDEVIIRVSPGGFSENWYPGLLKGSVLNFAWDTGNFLYYTQEGIFVLDAGNLVVIEPQRMYKIDMGKKGAPHFGRD